MAENETRVTIILDADKGSAAATQRLLTDISKGVKDLGKGNQLNGLDQSFDKFDASLTETGKRFENLTKTIKETKTSALELSAVKIDPLESAPDVSTGGGLGSRLTKAGAQLRNLPSTQIPGLGIGTDAIGNLARLSGALVGVGEKTSLVTSATAALTPVLGASAAGIGGIVVAAGPLVIALGALALALKSLSDQAAKEAESINATIDAQRSVGQEIAKGLTSEEATQKLEELKALRDDEAERIAKLNENYQANVESAGALSGVVKVLSGAEDALAGQIDKGKGLVTDYETQIAALTKAMKDGDLAANDAKEAQIAKGKEDEKAAKEAERAAEKAAREAEQNAEKIKQAGERIADAQRKNAEKQEDNARQAAQKVQDIERSAQDKRRDLALKYSDDLAKVALAAKRDEADAQRKISQIEADAATKNRQAQTDLELKQQRALEDIRQEGLKNEQDALRDRNFLAAAEAADGVKESLDDAKKAAEREAQDLAVQQQRDAEQRNVGYQREAQDRAIALNRARIDQATAYQQAQRDAKIAQDRALRDAQIAAIRQEESTQIAYNRELTQLQEHYNELLNVAAQGQAAIRSVAAGGQVPTLRSGTTSNTSNSTVITDNRTNNFSLAGGGAALIQQAVQNTVLSTMKKVSYR